MLFGKVAESGLSDSARMAVYLIVLRSIFDAPLLGYGYGTFIDIFPMFRDRSISVEGGWDQAHNTYLEVFQGLGVVFGTALVVCVVILVIKCFKGARLRREGVMVPAVATGVAFLVGVHSLAEFSLQIQAVTLTFAAILGAGVAQSKSSYQIVNDLRMNSDVTFASSHVAVDLHAGSSLMLSRIIWLLTALLVAGICIPPVWQGFELISYAMADD